MDDAQIYDFLATDPPRPAVLAAVRCDGRPHTAPVWYALDGRDLVFNTGSEAVKGHAARRDGRVALCVDDDRPPFSFVNVEGTATRSQDPEALTHWASVIGARYMGTDRAAEYANPNAVPGELVVRGTPARLTCARDVAN